MASEATGVSGLAARYATALFELADQQNKLDEVATDLKALRGFIDESEDLARLIRSPAFGREAQARGVAAVAEKAGFNQITRNFIGVVARNGRLFELKAATAAYLQLLAEKRGEVKAEVVAAQALTPAQLAKVNEQLKRAIGSNVAVETRVDPAIIGGLVVKVGSRMVDGSLRTKLERLQLAMRGN